MCSLLSVKLFISLLALAELLFNTDVSDFVKCFWRQYMHSPVSDILRRSLYTGVQHLCNVECVLCPGLSDNAICYISL